MLHTLTVEANDFLDLLLPEAVEHQRIPAGLATAETVTIKRYLRGAIQATQNYLDKDLWPTIHVYTCVCFPYDWTRGNVRSINAVDVADVVLPTQPALSGGMDLRAGRLRIGDCCYTISADSQLVIAGGFSTADDLPADVVQFILTAFGTHYAQRETMGTGSIVFNVEFLPKYLLDPYRTLSYA